MTDEPSVSIKSTDKTLLAIGGVAALVPFFISVSSSSTTTVNGVVASASYTDPVAIACGALAILCGLAGAALALKNASGAVRIAAGVAVVAVGGYQLAHGLGVFVATSSDAIVDSPPIPTVPAPKEVCVKDTCADLGVEADKTDHAAAFELWSHGCDLSDAISCHNAGVHWTDDANQPDKAVPFFDKACNLGRPGSCSNLGALYYNGTGVAKDLDRAVALFTKSCDGNFAQGCGNMSVVYRDGAGSTKADPAKELDMLDRACGLGQGSSCEILGEHYDNGIGVKKNLQRARELYTKGCDADFFAACTNLGFMFENGVGGAKDLAQARTLYQKACDGKDDVGCKNLRVAGKKK